jgi:hypothetical protein
MNLFATAINFLPLFIQIDFGSKDVQVFPLMLSLKVIKQAAAGQRTKLWQSGRRRIKQYEIGK